MSESRDLRRTLGTAIDATVGQRVAEATLLRDVRAEVIAELGTGPGAR